MLTERERQVLDRVVAGRSTKQIAAELGLSPRTVEVYRDHLREKLGAKNVADLVRLALTTVPASQNDGFPVKC